MWQPASGQSHYPPIPQMRLSSAQITEVKQQVSIGPQKPCDITVASVSSKRRRRRSSVVVHDAMIGMSSFQTPKPNQRATIPAKEKLKLTPQRNNRSPKQRQSGAGNIGKNSPPKGILRKSNSPKRVAAGNNVLKVNERALKKQKRRQEQNTTLADSSQSMTTIGTKQNLKSSSHVKSGLFSDYGESASLNASKQQL